MLTIIKRLTGLCLQSLHHCFIAWTKPGTPSLMLGVPTDLARSKSELVAENALLRQQLIILRRQVKRPACTKTDRMVLVLLARMVRTWKQAHITRSARDTPALASSRVHALLVLSELRTQKRVKAPWNADSCSSLAMRLLVAVLARRQDGRGKPVVVRRGSVRTEIISWHRVKLLLSFSREKR